MHNGISLLAHQVSFADQVCQSCRPLPCSQIQKIPGFEAETGAMLAPD